MSDWFVREQISTQGVTAVIPVPDHARLVAQQLGNTYGLLFMVGVAVLYTTTELRVVRNYLVALLIADVGHVGLTIVSLGLERFSAIGEWNAMTWGNVGFTVCLSICYAFWSSIFFSLLLCFSVSLNFCANQPRPSLPWRELHTF